MQRERDDGREERSELPNKYLIKRVDMATRDSSEGVKERGKESVYVLSTRDRIQECLRIGQV